MIWLTIGCSISVSQPSDWVVWCSGVIRYINCGPQYWTLHKMTYDKNVMHTSKRETIQLTIQLKKPTSHKLNTKTIGLCDWTAVPPNKYLNSRRFVVFALVEWPFWPRAYGIISLDLKIVTSKLLNLYKTGAGGNCMLVPVSVIKTWRTWVILGLYCLKIATLEVEVQATKALLVHFPVHMRMFLFRSFESQSDSTFIRWVYHIAWEWYSTCECRRFSVQQLFSIVLINECKLCLAKSTT